MRPRKWPERLRVPAGGDKRQLGRAVVLGENDVPGTGLFAEFVRQCRAGDHRRPQLRTVGQPGKQIGQHRRHRVHGGRLLGPIGQLRFIPPMLAPIKTVGLPICSSTARVSSTSASTV